MLFGKTDVCNNDFIIRISMFKHVYYKVSFFNALGNEDYNQAQRYIIFAIHCKDFN